MNENSMHISIFSIPASEFGDYTLVTAKFDFKWHVILIIIVNGN